MVKVFNETMNKESVVASPKDVVLDGLIISIEKGLTSEFVDPKYHDKFDNLEQEALNIHFECKFNDKTIKGTDRINYFTEPMSNSNLGKFLVKYGELKAGAKIKIIYDGDGFGKVKVD